MTEIPQDKKLISISETKIVNEFLRELRKVETGSIVVHVNQGKATEILTNHRKKLET